MQKNPKNKKQKKQSQMPPGSRGFSVLLGILTFLEVYELAMIAAIAPGNKDVAVNFYLSQSALHLLLIFLWYKQIRYMIREKKTFHPLRRIRKIICWFLHFLTPVHSGFKKLSEEEENKTYPFQRFREEYDSLLAEETDGEHTTQLYRHMLKLHTARLKKMGLSSKSSMTAMKYKNEEPVQFSAVRDGKFRHIHASEYIRGHQDYLWKDKKVYAVNRLGSAEYDIIGIKKDPADKNGKLFRCPNCGGVSTAQKLLDGCEYCKTKYLVEELKDRLCNMSFTGDPILKQKIAGLRITAVVNWVAFLFALLETVAGIDWLVFDVIVKSREWSGLPIVMILLSLTGIIFLVIALVINHLIFLPLRLFIFWCYRKQRARRDKEIQILARNKQKMEQIRRLDSEFSLNYFFSNVRNKLSAIHFATSGTQVEVFTTADLSEYIEKYNDIAECIFKEMELLSYEVSGGYRSVKIRTKAELLHWNPDREKMVKETEVLKLELQRSGEKDRRYAFGIHSFSCPSCGASLDLLKGNHCTYCGSSFNMIDSDWCITAYEADLED